MNKIITAVRGTISGSVGMFVIIAIAENTEHTVYTNDSFQQFILLTLLFTITSIIVECQKGSTAIEVAVDCTVSALLAGAFLGVKGNDWFTSQTGMWTILKESLIPLMIISLFATFSSSSLSGAIMKK